MKTLMKLLPLAFLTFALFSCDKNDDGNCVCTEEYDPVCGNDGVQYSNPCHADCAGVSYTEGICPQMTAATIQDLGDPAVDGCGWVIEFEVNGANEIHRPDTLAEEFKINDLTIQLTYNVTADSSICGFGPFIPLIEVVEIME